MATIHRTRHSRDCEIRNLCKLVCQRERRETCSSPPFSQSVLLFYVVGVFICSIHCMFPGCLYGWRVSRSEYLHFVAGGHREAKYIYLPVTGRYREAKVINSFVFPVHSGSMVGIPLSVATPLLGTATPLVICVAIKSRYRRSAASFFF